ncbi:TPA: LLM class flavin-dependent oxidoreductase, partial [Listeria monocytogenes]|nr:LLM class flavin-dependent oxidoreductase [Listeria monocytogenes]
EFASLIPIENAVTYLARYFDDYDLSQFDLDAPFPDLGDIGKNAFQSTTDRIKKEAKERHLTLRQVATEAATPKTPFIGTKEQVADLIEVWFQNEAADGFIIASDIPGTFETFVEQVIPLLQIRGLYRNKYPATTLRGNLGLTIPHNKQVVETK